MTWKPITREAQVEEIKELSFNKPQLIFKHSTRCSLSSIAKSRLERSVGDDNLDFNFLDLIAHKNISQKISDDFSVYHESPQVLLIKNGECIFDESHTAISMDEIASQL
ncbi:MAG: bacillithiol system redox-active protein YtxJ [Bacteroidota bacterium]